MMQNSDAAPVPWRVEVEKEGDEITGPVRLVTGPGESWEIQGVDEDCHEDEAWAKLLCEKHNATLYTHPEDAPRPDKASQGSTDSGGERPEQVEDAPWISQYFRRQLERVLVLVRRNVLPADLPNAESRLREAIRFLDTHPEDAPGGPWTAAMLTDKLIQGGVLCSYKMGTEEWYRWVARYARDHLKGDEK